MLLYIGDELWHIYTYENRSGLLPDKNCFTLCKFGWGLDLGRRFSLPHSCLFSLCLFICMRPVILNSFFFLFLGLGFYAHFKSYFVYFILMSFCSYSFFKEKSSFILINRLKNTR